MEGREGEGGEKGWRGEREGRGTKGFVNIDLILYILHTRQNINIKICGNTWQTRNRIEIHDCLL